MNSNAESVIRCGRYCCEPRIIAKYAAPVAATPVWRDLSQRHMWLKLVPQPLAPPAVAERSVVRRHPAPQGRAAIEDDEMESETVNPINLAPRYSTREIPGKCIKCLAEQELDKCLMALLRGEGDKETERKFEMLVSFLKSPESQKIRNEAERLLAQGKQVRLKICSEEGKIKYELETD
jgi:hypothetical protein